MDGTASELRASSPQLTGIYNKVASEKEVSFRRLDYIELFIYIALAMTAGP